MPTGGAESGQVGGPVGGEPTGRYQRVPTGSAEPDDVEHAFERFAEARMPALLRYAHLLTGDPHAAEDLVQTALARTLLAWPRVQRKDDPEGYVRRTMLTTQTNVWRRLRRIREQPFGEVPEWPDVRSGEAEFDERERVWAALRRLPDRQRAVLVLRYYEDLSEADIAATLGISAGTVKSQASKGLRRLRDMTGVGLDGSGRGSGRAGSGDGVGPEVAW